jgi:2-C-methyl-D-erythritol 4-phosphate cytidylyltransferase
MEKQMEKADRMERVENILKKYRKVKKADLIYLMGGKGFRTNLGYPKQFSRLGFKPIFIHGLEVATNIDYIDNIIIVTCDMKLTSEILKAYQFDMSRFILIGEGETRQFSVYNALLEVNSDFVFISEAVRPFITEELFNTVNCKNGEAITPIKYTVSTPISRLEVFNRNEIGEVQMPQKFKTELLLNSHLEAKMQNREDDTDDIYTYYQMYKEFSTVNGIEENIKITTPLDLKLAETIYKYKKGTIINE